MLLLRRGLLAALAVAFSVRAKPVSDEGKKRHDLVRQAANDASEAKQWREALALFQRAAAMPERDGDDLYGIYVCFNNLEDRRAAVVALTAVLRESPASIPEQDEDVIARTFRHSHELLPGDGARLLLLDAAFEAHYRTSLGEVLGQEWIALAGELLLRGDTGKAARVLAELDRPLDLVDARADKRFAALVDAQPARYDVAAAVRKRVERMQALVAKKPRSLEALIALAGAQKSSGQPAAALALLDRALTRVAAFDDRESLVNWLHNERSYVLWNLGRRDESTAELLLGMEAPESGTSNISQRINLAERYVDMGRPELAVKTLDELAREPTPYGRMAAELVRLAAADELGDRAKMQVSLEYLRGHEADAPHLLREGLVLAGLLDDAAQIFIGELDDSQFRTSALHEVQEFDPILSAGRASTPARWLTYWKRMLARPDVKATIARYGRVQSYPLPPQ
jgi:tetratricopeptide (TPR) repeat protein